MDSTALLTQGQQHLCCCALLRTHSRIYVHTFIRALLHHRPRGVGRKSEQPTTPLSSSLFLMRLCHAGYPLCRFHTCVNQHLSIFRSISSWILIDDYPFNRIFYRHVDSKIIGKKTQGSYFRSL